MDNDLRSALIDAHFGWQEALQNIDTLQQEKCILEMQIKAIAMERDTFFRQLRDQQEKQVSYEQKIREELDRLVVEINRQLMQKNPKFKENVGQVVESRDSSDISSHINRISSKIASIFDVFDDVVASSIKSNAKSVDNNVFLSQRTRSFSAESETNQSIPSISGLSINISPRSSDNALVSERSLATNIPTQRFENDSMHVDAIVDPESANIGDRIASSHVDIPKSSKKVKKVIKKTGSSPVSSQPSLAKPINPASTKRVKLVETISPTESRGGVSPRGVKKK